jgi:hypothetical protein
MEQQTSTLEQRINAWLEQLGVVSIIRTETTVTSVAEKANDGTYPSIVVTVWYELAENQ